MPSDPVLAEPALELTETLSVGEIFSFAPGQSTDAVKTRLRVDGLPDLRKSVPRLVSWTSVQSAVAGSLQTALHTPFLDTLADAWKVYDALRSDVKQSIESPQSRIVSTLAEHEIKSVLHPTIEVLLGAAPICELVFDVSMTTVIKGLLLTLQNGAIIAIEIGSCSTSGKIATHAIDLLKRELFTFKLPGELLLKKPIPL
ncbi:MAG: hypothetical protein ABI142_13810 [Bryocella sp.]